MRISTTLSKSDLGKVVATKRSLSPVLLGLLVIGTALTFYNSLRSEQSWWPLALLWSSYVLLLLFPHLWAMAVPTKVFGPRTIEFTDGGMIETTDLAHSFVRWAGVDSVHRRNGYILIKLTWYAYVIIRESDLVEPNGPDAVVGLVTDQIADARREG